MLPTDTLLIKPTMPYGINIVLLIALDGTEDSNDIMKLHSKLPCGDYRPTKRPNVSIFTLHTCETYSTSLAFKLERSILKRTHVRV